MEVCIIRTRLPVSTMGAEVINGMDEFISGLREKLGKDFDVIMEVTHIHIEYDPK